jgi:RHS repeat-associated protein
MKRKIKNIVSTIFLMAVMLLSMGNTCYAEVDIDALEGYLNGVVTQQNINQINNPKYANRSNTTETIDPITGNLILREADLSLPGKEGLDLTIGRVYNSAQDEFEKRVSVTSSSSSYTQTYTGYVVVVLFYNESDGTVYTNTIGTFSDYEAAVDIYYYYANNVVNCVPLYIQERTTITYYTDYIITTKNYPDKYSYYKTRYNLGAGWSFSFPSVQIEDYNGQKYMYYHDGTGAVYKIMGTVDAGGSNLEGYEGKDVKFVEDNGTYVNEDTVSSKYKFINSDKTTAYFAADGRLLGIKDRFGNQIKFRHTNTQIYDKTYPIISQIEDSIGRIIQFSYTGNNIVLTVTAPRETEQITITYERYYHTKEVVDDGTVIDTYDYPILFKVIDPVGRITYYEDYYYYNNNTYPHERYSYSVKNLTAASASADRYLLGSVVYAGAKTRYEYEKVIRNLGAEGATDAYRIKARYDQVQRLDGTTQTPLDWAGNYNRIDYTYSGDYTGYPAYASEDILPATYQFYSETTAGNGLKTKYLFNGIRQQLQKESTAANHEKKVVKNLEFDSTYKFKPTKTELTEYAADGTLASMLYIGMTYTDWGGLRSSTLPLTPSQYNDVNTKAKYITTYRYEDPAYPFFLTKKQYYQNDTTLLTESYSYDSLGRIASNTNAKGEITAYSYYTDEDNSRIEEVTKTLEDGKTAKTKYVYGSEASYAYPTEVINYYTNEWGAYMESRTGKTYDMLLGLVKTEMDAEYKITNYTYDKLGRLTSKQLPDFVNNIGEYYTVTEEYSYTNAYNLDYMDEGGYLYGTTVESYTRYVDNNDGFQSYYNVVNEFYDAYGNLRNSMSYNSKWINTEKYTYDNLLRVTSSVDAEGNTVTASYNAWGENNESTDALGNLYVSEYDVKNNKIMSYFVAAGNISGYRANTSLNAYKENYIEIILDQFGKAVERRAYENWPALSGELSEVYRYDIAGNLIGYIDPKRNLNEDGYTKTYQYDALNQMIQVKDALNQVTNVSYTGLGKIAAVSLKENNSSPTSITLYTKTYDEMGNLISKAGTSGEEAVNTYNGLGLTTQSIDRNGSTIFQNYDALNQLYNITQFNADYTIGEFYEYTYRTPFGYFDELKYEDGLPTAQSHYYYDQSGQVKQKNIFTGNIQSNLKLQYDDTGNLERLGAGLFDSNYFYSHYGYTGGRLTKVQTNGAVTPSISDTDNASYEYYPDGKLKKITYPRLNDNSLLTTEYVYSAIGRLTSVTNKKNSTILSSFAYTYDANGNIITVNDGTAVKNHVYDKLNRLIEIQPAVGNKTVYTYDLRGNRLTVSSDWFHLDLVDTGYTYDLQNRLKTVTKGSALTIMETANPQTEGKTVTGSALEVSKKDVSLIAAEDERTSEIKTITGSAIYTAQGVKTTTMEYYADGLRAGKYTEAGSDLYVYDLSGYLVAEAKNAATITANYVWGPDRVLSKKETGGGEYYYLYNGHGDVVQIVDRNGNVVNNYKYDEWGNILESNETISNPFKYAGEIYDEETGLYYLRARYYDPALGRFLNEDSVEGQVNNPLSLNLYTYCYNNPLIYIDPTGNTAKDFFTGLANALDDNLTGGALNWLVSKMLKVNHDYRYESGVDYYTGRVVGDVLSMLGGSGSIVSGIGTIVTSITGGGAITVSSGGTLVLGGGAIVVEGVIAGTAQVTYGGVVLEASAKNFGNDLNKLREASKSDGDFKINKKTGRVGSLSTKGEANSVTELYDNNGKLLQKRYYDSNGKVYKDIDFSHGNSDGTHTFPHEHNWDWSKKNPRQ